MKAGLPAERTDLFDQAHYDVLVGVGAISGIQAFLNWYKDWFGKPLIDAWRAANPGADVGNVIADPLGAAGNAVAEMLPGTVVLAAILLLGLLGVWMLVAPGVGAYARLRAPRMRLV